MSPKHNQHSPTKTQEASKEGGGDCIRDIFDAVCTVPCAHEEVKIQVENK